MASVAFRRSGKGFNPRLRAGGDFLDMCSLMHLPVVSIHASVREATVSTAGPGRQ